MNQNAHRPVRRLLAIVVVLLAAGCTSGERETEPQPRTSESTSGAPASAGRTFDPSTDQFAGLRRPWAHPLVPAGHPCPVTTISSRPDPELAPLLGLGPARPAELGQNTVLHYMGPRDRPDWIDQTWGGEKVLWAVDPTQNGPVLVRGRRLDGPGELAFEDPAMPELVLNDDGHEGRSAGWKDYPSYTRVRVPGCYAYQIDTADGTWTVVFMASGPSL